jgi:hypothetical protein
LARYYGIDEANNRLVELRPLLESLRAERAQIAEEQRGLERARGGNGSAEKAEQLAERESRIRDIVRSMEQRVRRLDEWGIALRDISTGLIDFPALANGRPIWLCWRLGEDAVAFWHEIDSGFDSRKPLAELT